MVFNSFKENNCRVCKKVFCCKNCREQHELCVHKVYADCGICLYGKAVVRDPAEHLVNHLKTDHWPLHCLFCKHIFGSLEEIVQQTKCPVGYKNKDLERSPYTSVQSGISENYESPPYFPKGLQVNANANMFSNLATSTPLQKDENNLSEKCTQENSTPVDYSDINKEKQYFNEGTSMKRKVTFSETPLTEDNQKEFEAKIILTPCSGKILTRIEMSPSVFYSAKQYPQKDSELEEGDENHIAEASPFPNEPASTEEKKELASPEDTTLWISAIASPQDVIKENTQPVEISFTPVTGKSKKRQINVVIPTAIRETEGCESPTHSTALDDFHFETAIDSAIESHNIPAIIFTNVTSTEQALSKPRSEGSSSNNVLSETSLNSSGKLWTSVSKIVKNVTSMVQDFTSINYNDNKSRKRTIIEYDSLDGPCIKRYKLTEIKCRRPIRDLARREYLREHPEPSSSLTIEVTKKLVDKATQTDDWLFYA
ncbi:hypothetical protein NQ315_010328 [Exocentrus adspersus]|uniref:C2H2-type domain-containing protein n=1 Tax=Exocentrus adspersus TaxID=1586481 RepID=A0AAV8WAX6_9CUCU|nr:hypothetical protein NQ315_010328 [Exocentrus adspersus]